MKDSAAATNDDQAPGGQPSSPEPDNDKPKLSRAARAMELQKVLDEQAAESEAAPSTQAEQRRRPPPSHALDDTDFDEDEEGTRGTIRPRDPDPQLKWVQYALTEEFQDMLLAAYIRHSDEFGIFHEVFDPAFFAGATPCSVALCIKNYIDKYKRVPGFSALANFCYQKYRGTPEQAEEVRDYVIKLEKLSTADWEYARDQAIQFAKRNALHHVVVEFLTAIEKGEEGKIDWEERFRRANRLESLGLPPVRDFATAPKVPPPDVLVDGLLHFSSKLAVGGSAKMSKSYLLLGLAVAVATGSTWLGRKCTRAKVLFVDFELHEGFFQERARKIAEAMRVEIEPGWLSYLPLRGVSTPANEILPKITRLARKDRRFVVLDPAYRMYDVKTTNENDMATIAGMMLEIEKICERSGAAVALVTHFAKGDQSKKASIDRIGGSRAFVADPDTILTFTALKEDDAYVGEAILRNFARPPKFCVRWKYPVFEIDPTLDPDDLRDPSDSTTYNDRVFMLPLMDGGLDKKKWKEAVVESTGMDKKTFDRRMPKLLASGKVLLKDGTYSLSKTGLAQMSQKLDENDTSDSE